MKTAGRLGGIGLLVAACRRAVNLFYCGGLCLALAAGTAWAATTYYVAPGGNDASDGRTWGTAKATIQGGVDATASGAGDTVIVSNGTYVLAATIAVNKGNVTVRGFTGDPRDVTVDGNNARRCMNLYGACTVQDLTIARGSDNECGGVRINGAGPTLRNCRLIANAGVSGGAARFASQATLDSCQVISNTASTSAGGLYIDPAGCLVTNCHFAWNAAPSYGGVYMEQSGVVVRCVFATNSATTGNAGGLWAAKGIVRGCTFVGNTSIGDAGGGRIGQAQMMDCVFSNNQSAYGAGLRITQSGGSASGCMIVGNRASVQGGGLIMDVGRLSNCTVSANFSAGGGGGIYAADARSLYIGYCTVSNNVAGGGAGGGLAVKNATVEWCSVVRNIATNQSGGINVGGANLLRNCLIAGNLATGGNGYGGGARLSTGTRLENCTVVRNQASQQGGAFYNDSTANSATNCIVYFNSAGSSDNSAGSALQWGYSCTTPSVPGPDNTDSDPAFADAGLGYGASYSGGDFRLTKTSPCKDEGIELAWMAGAFDLEGNPRLSDGAPDMGAYEFLLPPASGTVVLIR